MQTCISRISCRHKSGQMSKEEYALALQFILERVVEGRVTTKASVILQLLGWVCEGSDAAASRRRKHIEQENKFMSLLQHLPLNPSETDSQGNVAFFFQLIIELGFEFTFYGLTQASHKTGDIQQEVLPL